MWKKKNKQVPDERIVKETNHLFAKLYVAMTILSVIVLIMKLLCRLPWFMVVVESIALVVSSVYVLIAERKKEILFVKNKDDALKCLQNEVWTVAGSLMFIIILTGELILIFAAEQYQLWTSLYFVIWGIPALIYTIFVIKKGLFIWGGKKREAEGKKIFKTMVIMGAVIFGLIMGLPELFKDGEFQPIGLLWIIGMGAAWGILFYFGMLGMMKLSEKNADKQLEELENGHEE